MKSPTIVRLEERTARLTVLIDPRKKAVFERLCAQEDLTPLTGRKTHDSRVHRDAARGTLDAR
jgi:hypothetical protein